jgi:ABC-2 type transport system permease protein
MMRLLVAEVRRVATRRLVRLTFVLAVVGIALGGLAAYAWSDSLSTQAYEQRVAEAKADQRAQEAAIDACLQEHGVRPGDPVTDDIARQCFPSKPPGSVDDPRFHRTRLKGILQGVSGGLAVVGWALGASLVGAEFASRGMTTLLTWENRRWRVFLTKAFAAVAATSLLAVVVMALVALAMWPSLAFHGAPLRPNDPSLVSLAGIAARGVGLTAVASAVGFAIATVGRSTAAALGAGFAYVIVLENILGSFIARWRRWLLLGNVIVFISGENNGGDIPGRTVIGAGLFLAAVAGTLLVAAASTFHTRDLA